MLPQNNDKEIQVNDFKKDRIDGKLRWELLPLELIEDLVKVYDKGAKKYFVESWKQIDDGKNRCKGALLRHLLESETKDFDDETGCYHLAQVAWNALTMLWFRKQELKKETSNIDEFVKYSKETFGDLNHMNTDAVRVVGKDEEITPCAILKPVYITVKPKN